MFPLLFSLLLPISVLSLIRDQDTDLFLSDFSLITPDNNEMSSSSLQNVVPASTQTEELSIPEFNSSPKKVNRHREFHNGPPGFMPPKAVSKMREELTKDLDDNHFGFVTRKGRARVLGISRRRPDFSSRRHLI